MKFSKVSFKIGEQICMKEIPYLNRKEAFVELSYRKCYATHPFRIRINWLLIVRVFPTDIGVMALQIRF